MAKERLVGGIQIHTVYQNSQVTYMYQSKYKEVSILSHGPMQHISIWRQFELHTICISQGTTNNIHTYITDMVSLHIDSLYKHLLCKHTTSSAPASTVCSEVYGQSLQTCVAYRHEQEVTFIQELSYPAISMSLEHIEPSNGSNRRSLSPVRLYNKVNLSFDPSNTGGAQL